MAWLRRMVRGVELAVDGGLSATGVLHPGWDSVNLRETFVESVTMTRRWRLETEAGSSLDWRSVLVDD